MPLELIHNVQIVDPMLITIDAANVRIRPALVTNFPLQQAIVNGVLHGEDQGSVAGGSWRAPRVEWESSGEANGRASRVIAR